jgi:hypothetical protein
MHTSVLVIIIPACVIRCNYCDMMPEDRNTGSINASPRQRIHTQQQNNRRKQCFLSGPCRVYITWIKERYGSTRFQEFTRVEAGLNTPTVTLPVVGGDEEGSLKSETVTYGRESQGTRTRGLIWQGPAAYIKDRPILSSERAPHKSKTVTVKQQ